MQVPSGGGASVPAQLLWTAGNPGKGSVRLLDLALAPSPQAPLPAAAVLAVDDKNQVRLFLLRWKCPLLLGQIVSSCSHP